MTTAKAICDSVAPHGGRLITLQLRFPRSILAQFNTYGSIAKNARSSRAVPPEKIIKEVMDDPVMPPRWRKRSKGMVAETPMADTDAEWAAGAWLEARDDMAAWAREYVDADAEKETVNRLLEPWMWVDVVATAVLPSWCHYLNQRVKPDASDHHQELARAIGRAIRDSVPRPVGYGECHLPYVTDEELSGLDWADRDQFMARIHASVRRVRRVSYAPFDGTIDTPESDKAKHDESRDAGHWSCFEHQGSVSVNPAVRSGRMTGWLEYRQQFPKQVNTEFDFSTLD